MTTEKTSDKKSETRTLSCFFARELFSLQIEGDLDNAREAQVNEHLRHCRACTQLYEKAGEAKKILRALSKTEPVPSLVEYVKKEQYFWQDFYEQVGWTKWPSSLKWGVELTTVALVLVATIHFFPWLNLAKRFSSAPNQGPVMAKNALEGAANAPTRLAQNNKNGASDAVGEDSGATASGEKTHSAPNADNHAMEDLEPKSDVPEVGATKKKVAPTQMANTEPDGADDQGSDADQDDNVTKKSAVSAGDVAAAVAPVPPRAPVPAPETAGAPQSAPGAATTNDDEGTSEGPGGDHSGYLWRGTIKVDDLSDATAESITKKIIDQGGTKAGQVELGWHRGNQRYYHFIMPEENYEKLLNLLNEDGIVQLTKERHPRMIKSGYMRVILTLEESE